MLSQKPQAFIDVDHHSDRAECPQLVARSGQAAAAEAIEHERRDPHADEQIGPGVHIRADAQGAMDEEHRRSAFPDERQAQLAGNPFRRASSLTGQKLLAT